MAEGRGGLCMTRYIAFLRAINVGGRFVKMERLRDLFTALGFTNVRSVIQSGNIVFDAPTDLLRLDIGRTIEERLAAELGYDVAAMVRTLAEVEGAMALDPFRDVDVTADTRLCVLFISRPLPAEAVLPLKSENGEIEFLAATQGEVFAVVQQSAGRPGNPTAFLEKKYRLKATARFYSAVAKIIESARL